MAEREQGLSLLDIGPLSKQVDVGGKVLEVYGISVKGIAILFQRFPEARGWFTGVGGNVKVQELVKEAPDAIAAVIAAGCGFPGNKEAEEVAAKLPIEAQLDVLQAIAGLTFKNGFGPFAERIADLAEAAQSVNYGKAIPMNSPPTSKNSSPAATTASGSGT